MSEEKIYREGESVHVEMVGKDEEGKIQSEMTWSSYGYTNELGNEAQFQILERLIALNRDWTVAKNK